MKSWNERIMAAACALVLALVGTVWAITFGTLNGKAEKTAVEVGSAQEQLKIHGERIKYLEATQEENRRRLERIEKKQDGMDEKLNAILWKVDR